MNQGDNNTTSRTLEGRTPVQSILIRILYVQRIRSGRLLHTRVFNNIVVQSVIAIKAVHLEAGDMTLLGVPIVPFDTIKLDQALKEDAPSWIRAIFEEYLVYKIMNTYTIIKGSILEGRSLLLSKMVLRRKFNTKGEEIRKKARLYIQGDKQTPEIDYFETFVSVVRYNTFRFLMVKVVAKDLELDYIDIETVFLNLILKEEIYIRIPNLLREFAPELKGVKDTYLKLNKSLYSLKQVLREWFYIVKSFFESIGLKSANTDPNLFVGNRIFLLLFVNNILVTGKCRQLDTIKARILR